MNSLKKQWKEYINITKSNENIEYDCIEKSLISRKKQHFGGCCFHDGGIIGIPNSAREVLEIDGENKTHKTFGTTKIGTFKWTGGCSFNGLCYGFPRKENSILQINSQKEEIKEIPLDIHYHGEHHYGGVATPEGIVYQPPRDTDHILVTDLNLMKSHTVAIPGLDGKCRYSSSAICPDGDILMLPEYGFKPLLLHVDSEEVELFGDESDYLVFGAVNGNDGNIYGFLKEGDGILKVNVSERKAELICTDIGRPDCYGSIVGINGKIYGVPAGGNTIWEFDLGNQSVRKLFEIEEKVYANCGGGAVAADGTIVMMPCYGSYIYYLIPSVATHINYNNNLFLEGFY